MADIQTPLKKRLDLNKMSLISKRLLEKENTVFFYKCPYNNVIVENLLKTSPTRKNKFNFVQELTKFSAYFLVSVVFE